MPSKNGTDTGFQRLPKTVLPVNYDLTVEPDWTNHSFEATIIIEVDVQEATDAIILNASNLTVNAPITFTASGSTVRQEAEIFLLDLELQTLKITFRNPLNPGKGHLTIGYSGKVADNLQGFFRSKYTTAGGETRYNYLTHFEPTYARSCYPCWDEPSFKTTFDVTLIIPTNLVALSNMPVKEDTPHPSNITKKIVKFERSIKMSTYIMAFAIGEFDFVEGRTPDGTLCRVYTPVGRQERGRFALDVVNKALGFYNQYFGIAYPLPKMDLLAVTEFGLGAMENWGLVVFIEHRLLVDEKMTGALSKLFTALTTAHETAHMWFGNLVTMEWWSDLWLKEGFATFMEYLSVDGIYPEFQIWNLFLDDFRKALEMDASANSHPIQVTVQDPAQIGSIFDSISYSKGASIIRMIHSYIGDEHFREGLKLYLTRHVYGNAETKDLWAALSETSGLPIDKIMGTFTEQMGFPLVTVKSMEQVGAQKKITLEYDKFWGDLKSKEKNCETYNWMIPVTVRTQSDPSGVALKTLVEHQTGKEFTILVDSKEGEWVKLNADLVGYYRVAYPAAVLEGFVPSIKSKEMGAKDRVGLLDDLFALVKAGSAATDTLLKFMRAYENEEDPLVWGGLLDVISALNELLRGTPLHPNFCQYALSLEAKIYSKLGWEGEANEGAQVSVLRNQLLRNMIDLRAPHVIGEGKVRFDKHCRGEIQVSGDCRTAVYRAVAIDQGHEGFDALSKLFRATDLKEEKNRIIYAMGQTKDKAVVDKLFEFGRGKEVVMQDIVTILTSLRDQGEQACVWEYFCKNWEFFRDNFPTGHFLIRRIVEVVTSGFKTEEDAENVKNFFGGHLIKGVERTVAQSLEQIRNNKLWLERDGGGLQEFLGAYVV